MLNALTISLKMSLNLIKTYLLDEPGQKHLIRLDKWESQGFEYSSGRLLNGRTKSNYALMGIKKEHFEVLLTEKHVSCSHAPNGDLFNPRKEPAGMFGSSTSA